MDRDNFLPKIGKRPLRDNDNHVHFIGILPEVPNILKPRTIVVKPGPAPLLPFPTLTENAEPSTLGGEGNLHTRFANLLIEYTADEYFNLPNLQPTSGASETARYEFEEVSDDKGSFLLRIIRSRMPKRSGIYCRCCGPSTKCGPLPPFRVNSNPHSCRSSTPVGSRVKNATTRTLGTIRNDLSKSTILSKVSCPEKGGVPRPFLPRRWRQITGDCWLYAESRGEPAAVSRLAGVL